MNKFMFNFTKEMANILRQLRKNANLTQEEVATRMGIKTKYGQSIIAQIEMGKVHNPSLRTIVDYIRVCGASWVEFFKELDRIDFKMRHEKMISQLPIPPTQRKIQRDAMRYEINIEFPSKEKEEIDFDRLKKQIKDKVIRLVNKEEDALTPQERGGEAVVTAYQKFAMEYFDFMATLNKAGMRMVSDKYQRAGLKLHLLVKIKKIINSVLRGEIKRIEAKKPLPPVKQEKMTTGFTKYRIAIERIESEVHKLLCAFGVKTTRFVFYKDFAREYYQTLKKYYGKNQKLLAEKQKNIFDRWLKEGLHKEILIQLQQKIESMFIRIKKK